MIRIHRFISDARARGAPWDEIDNFVGGQNRKAAEAGFSPMQILTGHGYTPQRLRDQLEAEAAVNYAMQDAGPTT